MNLIKDAEEDFHRPRLAGLAEYLLSKTKFKYEFFSPPTLDLYMIQLSLDDETHVAVNYLPVELNEELPFLFLQLYCTVADEISKTSADLINYILFANNNTMLSAFYLEADQVYIKSLITQQPETDFEYDVFMFHLNLFQNNLKDHQGSIRSIIKGSMTCAEAIDAYQKMRA